MERPPPVYSAELLERARQIVTLYNLDRQMKVRRRNRFLHRPNTIVRQVNKGHKKTKAKGEEVKENKELKDNGEVAEEDDEFKSNEEVFMEPEESEDS